MALSRRTADTDMLTIRQVWAYDSNDAVIPALRCLTTDGAGGTFWAVPSSLGGIPAFNTVIANNVELAATAPSNALIISTFGGLAMNPNSNTNRIDLAATCFTTFEVSSGNTLVAYSNNTLTPTVRFVARGSLDISADPLTNTLYFQTQATAISTSIFGYNRVNVISNASTMTYDALNNSNNTVLTATSPSSILQIVGLGDILISTNVTSNAMFIGISSFSASSFNALSTVAYSAYASTLSTVSTLFIDKTVFSTTMSNLSTSIAIDTNNKFQFITNNYTTNALFQFVSTGTGSNVSTLFKQTLGLNGGTLSSLNIYSSLTVTPFGLTAGDQDINSGTFTFSTSGFSLASLLSPLLRAQTVAVSYHPSFLINANELTSNIVIVSTLLYAADTVIPNSIFTRPLWKVTTSTLVTDSIEVCIKASDILSSLTSSYRFVHILKNYSSAVTSEVTDLQSPTNSLAVRIGGTNFAGVY